MPNTSAAPFPDVDVAPDVINKVNKTQALVGPSTMKSNGSRPLRSSLSSGRLSDLLKSKDPRNVKFSGTIQVCLIPTRHEFAGHHDDLFWSGIECQSFKFDAVREIRAFAIESGCTPKEAIKALYQVKIDDSPTKPSTDKSSFKDSLSIKETPSPASQLDISPTKEIEFVLEIKTDVELNSKPMSTNSHSKQTNMPIRTPSSLGASEPQQQWYVEWRKNASSGYAPLRK